MTAIRKSDKSRDGKNGGDIDTLYILYTLKELDVGNLPSKVSRNHLIANGYAKQTKRATATRITLKGKIAWFLYRNLKVRV